MSKLKKMLKWDGGSRVSLNWVVHIISYRDKFAAVMERWALDEVQGKTLFFRLLRSVREAIFDIFRWFRFDNLFTAFSYWPI